MKKRKIVHAISAFVLGVLGMLSEAKAMHRAPEESLSASAQREVGKGFYAFRMVVPRAGIPVELSQFGEDVVFQEWLKAPRRKQDPVPRLCLSSSVTEIAGKSFMCFRSPVYIALEFCSRLQKVGEGAFSYSSGLSSLFIPASVEALGEWCCFYCESLTSITFEPHSRLRSIGTCAFVHSCLKVVTIPASVEELGQKCFSSCQPLSFVTFETGSRLLVIREQAFTDSGLRAIAIPAGVVRVEEYCFPSCLRLTTVVFEEGA
ncbi:MAG: leucine-rich repeat domain-containing protein [Holosporales bacterium]|nr:leucine-rich repeat domain-containing protein [Holosporales bacterium]